MSSSASALRAARRLADRADRADSSSRWRAGLSLLAATTLVACYSPKGGAFPKANGPQTYESTPMEPVSIRMMDVCGEGTFFEIDIPPQKQFVCQFVEGGGDDPSRTPDVMKWAVMDMGKRTGRLRNQLSVPPSSCRRVDYYLRPPEPIPADPSHRLRTDSGVVPASTDPNIYDG